MLVSVLVLVCRGWCVDGLGRVGIDVERERGGWRDGCGSVLMAVVGELPYLT